MLRAKCFFWGFIHNALVHPLLGLWYLFSFGLPLPQWLDELHRDTYWDESEEHNAITYSTGYDDGVEGTLLFLRPAYVALLAACEKFTEAKAAESRAIQEVSDAGVKLEELFLSACDDNDVEPNPDIEDHDEAE